MNGAERIAAERKRQQEVEGWTPEHDAQHVDGELTAAAIAYCMADLMPDEKPIWWPWADEWWKPDNNSTRNLEKAGALIAAEIDRLVRDA